MATGQRWLFDPLLIFIGLLLATTIGSFLGGLFPYPFGVVVLGIFFAARLLHLRSGR